ncbi:hypothetical protein AB6A40_006151 [Gnathostoma spinigerum]|uniref:ABC-2 type transporter transmembrane domain-containing protein n=1 Tax=Gnathostoma spinigerum TaxID=75299 RepID=A0ABD6ERW8_9BILA
MKPICSQLSLLLWKSFLIRKRQKITFILELGLPILLFLILVLVRLKNFEKYRGICHYDARAMPSAGILPFAQGFICYSGNKCHQYPTSGNDTSYLYSSSSSHSVLVDTVRKCAKLFYLFGESPDKYDLYLDSIIKYLKDLIRSKPNSIPSIIGPEATILQNIIPSEVMDIIPIIWRSNVTSSQSKLLRILWLLTLERLPSIESPSFRDFVLNRAPQVVELLQGADDDVLPIVISVVQDLVRYENMDELKAAIQCGDPDPTKREDDLRGPTTSMEEAVGRMLRFVMSVVPGVKDEGETNKSCFGIPVSKDYRCSFIPSQLKAFSYGYILVGPDSPIVRNFVQRLEIPFKWLNVLFDSVEEFVREAPYLQDKVASSDLPLLMKKVMSQLHVIFDMFEWGPKTEAALNRTLEHLFQSSNDSESLFMRLQNVAKSFLDLRSCFRRERFIIVENETSLVSYAMCLMETDDYFTSIYFHGLNDSSTDFPSMVQYDIRHPPDFVDSTGGNRDGINNVGSRDRPFIDLKYISFGFSFLQDFVDTILIEMMTNKSVDTGLFAQQEPFPCNVKDQFNVMMFFPMFVFLSWVLPTAMLAKNIVYEKEMRLKETMRVMGLGDAMHWIAWAIQSFLITLISVIIITLLLKFGNILPNSDMTLVMAVLLLFTVANICQCLFISTFFFHSNIASAAAAVFFFLFFFPFQISWRTAVDTVTKISLLFPQTAVGFACVLIMVSEQDSAASWSNVDFIELDRVGLNLLTVMTAFIIDSVIYATAAWYFSAVFPGRYGIPQPFYFPFTRRYWFGEAEHIAHHVSIHEDKQRCVFSPFRL